MTPNDTQSAADLLDVLLKGMAALLAPVLAYFGVRYQYRKRKEGLRDSHGKEQFLHSKIAQAIQNNTDRLRISNNINRELDQLYSNTRSDRFIAFIAINGKHHYSKVSAIYQWPRENKMVVDAVKVYDSIPIDDAYRAILKKAGELGVVNIYSKDIEGTLLGDIYKDEGVVQSRIYFISRIPLEEKGKDIMVYISIATFHPEGFTAMGINKMNLLVHGNLGRYINEIVGHGGK